MPENQDRNLHLVHFALALLSPGKKGQERFVFEPNCQAGLKIALDDLFASPLDAKQELEALMRLGWSLSFEMSSPAAADAIIQAVSAHERALGVLAIGTGDKSKRSAKAFARFTDLPSAASAPVFGSAAPSGSVKVSSFLDAGGGGPSPARSAPRGAIGSGPADRRPKVRRI
jgi:hypothetical protein